MYVIPQAGCSSSLYVELSMLDETGNVIGIVNSAIGGVRASEQAKMIFDTFEEDSSKARLSEISCY